MIKETDLEIYMHQNIPLSQALGIHVDSATPQKVVLTAPFSKNINHKKTVFGGSLHAVATLACWSLIYCNLENLQTFDIVITSSTVQYLKPITCDFTVICEKPEDTKWNRFISALSQKEKGRIALRATISQDGKLAVEYEGTFAAIKRS